MDNLVLVIDKSLETWDEVYFKKINSHSAVVKSMQETHSSSMKFLSDKVFNLSTSIQKFTGDIITKTNNAMALVCELCQDQDKKYDELKDRITLSSSQVASMVETIRYLMKEVVALCKDAAKKGEKSQPQRVQ